MKKISVIGAGMVGSAMALDLAQQHEVTLLDKNNNALKAVAAKNTRINTCELDVSSTRQLKANIANADLVICAVPGFLGYHTLQKIIEAGKDVVDISFFPENALDLDEAAKKKGVTAIVDCGVAPGLGNFILGSLDKNMQVSSFECLVGGLPKVRKWPFAYKAPFSPIDVIEEYTRPARYKENGQIITKPALSDVEHVYFEQTGTLESFNSDGLRSLLFTMEHIPNMKEKTLRYPGHIDYILALKESGFFSEDKLRINEASITPLDATCAILFKDWKLAPDEEELTIMRIKVAGTRNGQPVEITYTLYDEFDKASRVSSMARTTGYTATAAAHMVLSGQFNEKGIFPPELVGAREGCLDGILDYLKARNIILEES